MTTQSCNRLALAATLVFSLAGCIAVNVEQRPNPARHYFALDVSGKRVVSQGNKVEILKLVPVRVAHRYDSKGFIYRIGSDSFEVDFYNQFLVAPGPMLTDALRQALGQSNLFKAVLNSTSMVEPTQVLESVVDELYGDFSDNDPGEAVLAMSFVVRQNGAANGSQVILQKGYEKTIVLKARSAEALVQGWNRALEEIIAAFVADLEALGTSANLAEKSRPPQ